MKGIDKIIVISLKRRSDRLNTFKESVKSLTSFSLQDVEVFEAIDGYELEPTPDIINLFKNNNFNYRCGVVGCALSHYSLIKKIIENGWQRTLIFEDDVSFLPNFDGLHGSLFDGCINKVIENMPDDTDLLYLGGNPEAGSWPHLGAYNDYIGLANEKFNYGGYSYILTLEGAKKVDEIVKREGIKCAFDFVYRKNQHIINTYCSLNLLTHSGIDVNSNVQLNYQTIFDRLKQKEKSNLVVNLKNNEIINKYLPKIQFSLSFGDQLNLLESNVINFIKCKKINYIKNDVCISNYLKNGILWEDWMFKHIKKYYKENTNMIDIGGHIGTTSLMMNDVLSDGCKIYTFEPITQYNDILLKNIVDNNLNERVILYPYGAGNKEETICVYKISLANKLNFGSISLSSIKKDPMNKSDNYVTLKINIIPIDLFNFENISLMKIDVEEMENDVLEGCINLIKRCKPTIIIEIHMLDKFKQTNIFKELEKFGYNITRIPDGHIHDYIMTIN